MRVDTPMTKIKTGIPGFDELVEGGFVPGSTILLSGQAGTGKSIFGLQFLYEGANTYNEPGILITLETRPNQIHKEAEQFGWNLVDLVKDGKFVIIDAASSKAGLPTSEKYALRRGFDMTQLAEIIYKAVDEYRVRRLVLDCISGLTLRFSEPGSVRQELHRISSLLNELGVTSIFISEINDPDAHSRIGEEEFVAHGLILLKLKETSNELQRGLLIWKMRQRAHSMKRHKFSIGSKGIVVD